jgi:hypothetical protein
MIKKNRVKIVKLYYFVNYIGITEKIKKIYKYMFYFWKDCIKHFTDIVILDLFFQILRYNNIQHVI